MDDPVDQVKRANPIEDVIEALGVALTHEHGKYVRGERRGAGEHGLVVNVAEQFYFWNGKDEGGDVINFVCNAKNWDFKTAVEWLAERARLPRPEWGREDNTVRLAARAREDALTVAARIFVKRLRGNRAGQQGSDGKADDSRPAPTAAAAYCGRRGWDAETVRLAGLGYTGGGTSEERRDLEGEMEMHQVEGENPGRRAAMGIPAGMLVYPHVVGGRVRYLSCRSIEGKEHYNLPKELAGGRQCYFNWVYSSRETACVIVEGQADAITLGQWGYGAVALAGTSWKDHSTLIEELRGRHKELYVGLDADEAGERGLRGKRDEWELGFALGGMCRVVRWGGIDHR